MKIELNKKLENFLVQLHHIMKEKGINASVQSIVNNMLLLDLAENHDINIMRKEGFTFPTEKAIDSFIESFARGRKIYVKDDYDGDFPDNRSPDEIRQEHLEWLDRNRLTLTKIVGDKGDNMELELIEPEPVKGSYDDKVTQVILSGEPLKDKCPKCETINNVYNSFVGANEYKCRICGHIWEDKLIDVDIKTAETKKLW